VPTPTQSSGDVALTTAQDLQQRAKRCTHCHLLTKRCHGPEVRVDVAGRTGRASRPAPPESDHPALTPYHRTIRRSNECGEYEPALSALGLLIGTWVRRG